MNDTTASSRANAADDMAIVIPNASPAVSAYSQGVRRGGFLQVAGQGPMDAASGAWQHPGDVGAQTRLTLEHVRAVLEAGGATLDDTLMIRVYLTDRSHFAAMNEAYDAYMKEHCGSGVLPARTTIICETISEQMMVEIDALAVVPS